MLKLAEAALCVLYVEDGVVLGVGDAEVIDVAVEPLLVVSKPAAKFRVFC